MRDKALDTDLGAESTLQEVLTREGLVAAIAPVIRLKIEVGLPHARRIRRHAFALAEDARLTPSSPASVRLCIVPSTSAYEAALSSFLALLGVAEFPSLLNGISLLFLHITHLIEHETGFADLATEEHQGVLIKVLDVATLDTRWRLGEVALLRAFETERVRDALFFIAVESSTVLLVALILEPARLEPKYLR